MDMYIQKTAKALFFSIIFAILYGCGPMDNILPSSTAYKVNVNINGMPLEECSFAGFDDIIRPYFEEKVANDPDVKTLVVFLKNSRDEIAGWKVVYSVDQDYTVDSDSNERLIVVKNMDSLPPFPVPESLPAGRYTMVSQVMGEKDILQKTESVFYYLKDTSFSFEGINAYLPGIADSLQVISKGLVIMLETKLKFDSFLDPYIIWYNGSRKISEGYFSNGAGQFFFRAPDQSGFYSLRAEVFPIRNYEGLAGYQNEISLLVSSKSIDANLVSNEIPQLLHWYVFDGNINDSRMPASAERALKPAANNKPVWMAANGTYGLATGYNNLFTLPKLTISPNRINTWQALFRFLPVNEGQMFSVLFGSGISMNLGVENKALVLRLASSSKTVSQSVSLPEQELYITAGISFSIYPGGISASINIMGDSIIQNRQQINLDANIEGDFHILLGLIDNNTEEPEDQVKIGFTALWDEFAVYYMPPMDIISAEIRTSARVEQSESDDFLPN
jgi:hypothetical protein